MSKLIKWAGVYFRVRRGKLARIPDEWVGHVTHPQTTRKRKRRANEPPDHLYRFHTGRQDRERQKKYARHPVRGVRPYNRTETKRWTEDEY